MIVQFDGRSQLLMGFLADVPVVAAGTFAINPQSRIRMRRERCGPMRQ